MRKTMKNLSYFTLVFICLPMILFMHPGWVFAQVTANAGPDQENVGFGTAVQLNGTGSTGTPPLTYNWVQTLGLRVTLSDHTSSTPTFTTPAMSDMILNNEQETFGILGIQPNFLEVVLQLTVTDAAGVTSTDLVAISLMEPIRTTGLPNVAVGTPAYLRGPASQTSFNWTLRGPFFSQATLSDINARFPHFRPDATGDYTITETTTGQTINIHAATWSGIRKCAACHAGQLVEDKVTPWLGTGHATMFTEAVDGLKSPYYNASCIECHTVGYDTSPEADNGGFDDIANGFWTFPQPLQSGNWDNIVNNFPELANLSNIQCESCHGPGSDHYGELDTISKGYSEAICGFCHNEGSHHVKNEQLRYSLHSTLVEDAVESTSCTKCHTAQGFVEIQIRGKDPFVPEDPQPQICQACHDPHENRYEHQLRAHGSAELPNGVMVENAGAGAICIMCHNSRRVATEVLAARQRAPHGSPQGDMLAGTNAMEISGVTYTKSFHASDDLVPFYFSDTGDDVNNKCVTCHMATNSVTGLNHVTGEHSFNMSAEVNGQEVQNLDACNICHINLTSFDRRARGDYDGDGVLEGVQTEVGGLLEVVKGAIDSSLGGGTFESSHGAIVFHDASGNQVSPSEAQYIAAYNYLFVLNDGSYGIHNTAYAAKLLQSGYQNLTGQPVPSGTPRSDIEPLANFVRRKKADF
ncbi:MAG: hypothetical protein V2A69_15415 [Pseudomonadota bacterium]